MYTLHIQPSEIDEFTLVDFLDNFESLESIRKWQEQSAPKSKR